MNRVLTLEEVRAVLADKSCAGHTDAVRALLHKHGAEKLSEIDPAVYPALLQDAEALKAHPRRAGRVAVGKGRCNMKLTDAERALVERARSGMDEACENGATYSPFWIVELVKIIDRLSEQPEVVRCGECKNSSRIASDISGHMRHCWNGRGRNNGDGFSRVHQDDYCDEGKRKEGT